MAGTIAVRRPFLALVAHVVSGLSLALSAVAVFAADGTKTAEQAAPRVVNPRPYGIDLPAGAISAGNGRAVTTHDKAGRPVVGRIHVQIGDGAVIFLPDGQLVVRKGGEFSPTDRKFVPDDNQDVVKALAAEFPGMKTRTTNHYVYVYNASEEFAKGTGTVLESMLPGVKAFAELRRLDARNPEFPLVVVIFRTEGEFQRHSRMRDGVIAYFDTLSNRIFMYEQSRLAEVRPDLALGQATSTIAHEGAHQILHNIGVQQRLSHWPMWLNEGLAEYLAPTSTSSRQRWKGAGQINDLRMFELEQYVNSKAAEDSKGEMVEHTVLASQLTSTGYASAWALTHFVAETRRTEFNQLLRETSRLGPFEGATEVMAPGVVRSNREIFSKYFGDDFKELELKLVAYLKKQPYTDPFKEAPHIVATLTAGDGRKSQKSAATFHTWPLAQKWQKDSLDKVPAAQRSAAKSTLRVLPNRQQAEAYTKQWLQGK